MVQHIGGLFAAKEAVLKALGTGWERASGSATSRSFVSRDSAPPSGSMTAPFGARASSASPGSMFPSPTSADTPPPWPCSRDEERYHEARGHGFPVQGEVGCRVAGGAGGRPVDQARGGNLARRPAAGNGGAWLHRPGARREHRRRVRPLRRRLEHVRRCVTLTLLGLVALGLVLYYFWRTPDTNKGVLLSLALILGGAVGNLVDRVIERLGHRFHRRLRRHSPLAHLQRGRQRDHHRHRPAHVRRPVRTPAGPDRRVLTLRGWSADSSCNRDGMGRQIEPRRFLVAPEDRGQRLDVYLARQLEVSRSRAQRWIRDGGVTVDGLSELRSSRTVADGDTVECRPRGDPGRELTRGAAGRAARDLARTST